MCFLSVACLSGVNLTSGQKVTAVILHVDFLSTCVYVSILSKLVAKKKSVSVTLFAYLFHAKKSRTPFQMNEFESLILIVFVTIQNYDSSV